MARLKQAVFPVFVFGAISIVLANITINKTQTKAIPQKMYGISSDIVF